MDGWVPKMWFCCLPKELELHWNVYLQSCYKWFMRCLYLNVTADSCQELFLPWHNFSHCSFSFFSFLKILIFPCVYSRISSVRPSWQRERACWHGSVIFENGFCVDMTFWLEIVCVCEWVNLTFMRSLSGFLYFCNFIITNT